MGKEKLVQSHQLLFYKALEGNQDVKRTRRILHQGVVFVGLRRKL
jgi:hypothetical protein